MLEQLEVDAKDLQRLQVALYLHRRMIRDQQQSMPSDNPELAASLAVEYEGYKRLSGRVAALLTKLADQRYARQLRAAEMFGGLSPDYL